VRTSREADVRFVAATLSMLTLPSLLFAVCSCPSFKEMRFKEMQPSNPTPNYFILVAVLRDADTGESGCPNAGERGCPNTRVWLVFHSECSGNSVCSNVQFSRVSIN